MGVNWWTTHFVFFIRCKNNAVIHMQQPLLHSKGRAVCGFQKVYTPVCISRCAFLNFI